MDKTEIVERWRRGELVDHFELDGKLYLTFLSLATGSERVVLDLSTGSVTAAAPSTEGVWTRAKNAIKKTLHL